MMNTIIKENGITFKELEKNIFQWICEMGRNYTKELLERYDDYLKNSRDKSVYRHKGLKRTVIKTVYGEVVYSRVIYEVKNEDGTKRFVYLLDETLELDHIGLISTNLAGQLVSGITEMSYRECAKKVSEMTGQRISAMGVWNVIQALGEKVCEEEQELVQAHKKGELSGEKEVPVLFEEADGVYVSLQGNDRKKSQQKKAEIKVAIAYDGWKKTGKDRYELRDKVVVAGFSKAKRFHEYREAAIAEKYNLDETQIRLLNADGAGWIKKVKDRSTYFQLDPFHKYKAIKENIAHKSVGETIRKLLDEGEIEEMFDYLGMYCDSLTEENDIKKAKTLLQYFQNNRKGLLPYQEQGIELPPSPEGLDYRNMGTMENHIWSVIARRMKHNHTSWSIRGGNHLSKILAKKCSGRLYEVTERIQRPLFEEDKLEAIQNEILMSAKIPKKVGKGYRYPIMGHLASLDTATRGSRNRLLAMAGF